VVLSDDVYHLVFNNKATQAYSAWQSLRGYRHNEYWFWLPLGKKRRVLCNSGPVPSGRRVLYAMLNCVNPRRLKALWKQRTWSIGNLLILKQTHTILYRRCAKYDSGSSRQLLMVEEMNLLRTSSRICSILLTSRQVCTQCPVSLSLVIMFLVILYIIEELSACPTRGLFARNLTWPNFTQRRKSEKVSVNNRNFLKVIPTSFMIRSMLISIRRRAASRRRQRDRDADGVEEGGPVDDWVGWLGCQPTRPRP